MHDKVDREAGAAPAARQRLLPLTTIPGVVGSVRENTEWHLRIVSLLVGLAVEVLSLIGLWRKMRRRR